jgi:hypothetical protein
MTEYTLSKIPQLHIYQAIMGVYDSTKDYVGPAGSSKAKYIPKKLKISRVNFNPCAYIHDAQYIIGGCEECREISDLQFYYNMRNAVTMSESLWPWGTDWIRKDIGRIGARAYYIAVDKFGADSFNFHNECKHLRKS